MNLYCFTYEDGRIYRSVHAVKEEPRHYVLINPQSIFCNCFVPKAEVGAYYRGYVWLLEDDKEKARTIMVESLYHQVMELIDELADIKARIEVLEEEDICGRL